MSGHNMQGAHVEGHLQLAGVTKRFVGESEAPPAVAEVDLDVADGEFVTLLGPSGCGKTTTLRIIAGFETPTSGSVRLGGADMLSLPPNRRPMAMVFQSYALFPHMSVRDNVSYGLRIEKERKPIIQQKVDIILTSMNLLSLAERFPHQLSGGQQQRVALARAMVMQPSVLLFDEPLSNLDAKLRDQMRTEIRMLQRRMGITSIYVTHDQSEAMSMSDRIVVMNAGRVEQVAPPGEVYARPASVFVADFIGRASFLPVVSIHGASSDRVRIDVLGQEAAVAFQSGALDADETVLMVRPEAVRLTASGEDANGVVVSTVYLGVSVEYEVETRFGQVLVSVANPDPRDLLDEGTPVRVTVDEDRAYLLGRSRRSGAAAVPEPVAATV